MNGCGYQEVELGTSESMATTDQLIRQLRRLLVAGRFGPLVLHLRGGRRVSVDRRENIRLSRDNGTIVVATSDCTTALLFEDLVAIELPPRTK